MCTNGNDNPEPNKSPIHYPLFFNGIARVVEQKHLGLILDPKLTFVKHIISKSKVARKNIDVLKQLSPYLLLKTIDQLYKIFVRSHIDYCNIIFHSSRPFSSIVLIFGYIKYNYGDD